MAVLTVAEALEMAMEIEENGETFYNKAAAQSTDTEIKTLFETLAAEERGHYHVFQKMRKELKSVPEPLAEKYDEYQAYLQVELNNALFAGPDKALELAKQAQDRSTALRAEMGFEKDTMLFFYDLREMVREADRETISNVIREEKKHLRRLAKMV
jgi:rubrerythrin